MNGRRESGREKEMDKRKEKFNSVMCFNCKGELTHKT